MSGAYKKTATLAFYALTGIPPLHLRVFQIATSWKVLILGTPEEEFRPQFYQNKSPKSTVCPYKNYLHKANENLQMKIQIYTDGFQNGRRDGVSVLCIRKLNLVLYFSNKIKDRKHRILSGNASGTLSHGVDGKKQVPKCNNILREPLEHTSH